jgi:hypothetical protein
MNTNRGFGIAIVIFLSCTSLVFSSARQATSRHPSGVLTGRVVDDEGRPMRGAQVQALAFGYQNAVRVMLPRGNTATTNDRGEFRIFWLEPGTYYLVVQPNASFDAIPFPTARSRLAYTPADPDATFVTTYFPGTPDIRNAGPIQVGPGELDVHAIQVASLPTRLIRLRVVNSKLTENSNYSLLLPVVMVRSLGNSTFVPPYRAVPRPLGNDEFEMRVGLAPGQYQLLLLTRLLGASFAGSAVVTIDRADPNTIDVPVSRTISFEGQVVMEGSISDLRIIAVPSASRTPGFTVSSEVRPNGKFVIEDVLPGAYTISVDGGETDAYLHAVSLQGEELPSTTVEFRADVQFPKLTLRIKRGAAIAGVVIDDTRTAQANVGVMLIPETEHRSRQDLFRFAITNDQGGFQIRGVVPGNYTIVAVLDMEGDAFRDPAFLEQLSANGTPLTVSSGGRLNLDLIQLLKR